MSTVTQGNPVTLDALFAQAGQPTPDTVVFQVQQPDNSVEDFTSGVDPAITNPAADYW